MFSHILRQEYDPTWIPDHPFAVGFLIALAVGCIVDLWLKFTGRISISEWVWQVCLAHPTLYSLGLFLTFGIMYLVRDQWGLVGLVGYLGGHLFSGIVYVTSLNLKRPS